jgi:hypothetical protein
VLVLQNTHGVVALLLEPPEIVELLLLSLYTISMRFNQKVSAFIPHDLGRLSVNQYGYTFGRHGMVIAACNASDGCSIAR